MILKTIFPCLGLSNEITFKERITQTSPKYDFTTTGPKIIENLLMCELFEGSEFLDDFKNGFKSLCYNDFLQFSHNCIDD